VKVTYTVTTAPGQTVGWTGAALAGVYESDYVGASCDTGCTLTATFDTTGVPVAPTANGAEDFADGPQTITVNASSAGASSSADAHVSVPVIVDNERPSDGLVVPQPDPQTGITKFTATDRLNVEAYPKANDGGSVTAMRFHYLNAGVRTVAPLTPPTAAGRPWTLDLDTSAWPQVDGSGWVSTTDERGISSIGTMLHYVVDRGMSLTGPPMSGTVNDFAVDVVKLQYSYSTSNSAIYPASVTTYLDGTDVGRRALPPPGSYSSDPPGVITARSDARTPPGEHDLRYVVTDNRGVSNEVDYHVTVKKTLDISWTGGPGQSVLPGSSPVLTGTADTTDTTLLSSTFFLDDRVLDGWGCYVGDCPTHLDAVGTGQPYPEVYTPGQHTIRWEVHTKDGAPLTLAGTITVLPYATTAAFQRDPATYGRTFALAGQATLSDGRPATGATVTLQRQPLDGSDAWTTLGTARTDESGRATFSVRAVETAVYRMVTADELTSWAGRAGPSTAIGSYADLVATKRPNRGRMGDIVKVRGIVAPAGASGPLYLQEYRHHRWTTRSSTQAAGDGTFTIRYRLHRPKARLRLLRPASSNLLTTATPTWLVTAH
jgi:hypothetical protein